MDIAAIFAKFGPAIAAGATGGVGVWGFLWFVGQCLDAKLEGGRDRGMVRRRRRPLDR